MAFSADEVKWLQQQPAFGQVSPAFFDYLRSFRFSGDVWALREGTPFFPMEPVLRVTAPIAEAQLESGAFKDALSSALEAQQRFSTAGQFESEWRASLIAPANATVTAGFPQATVPPSLAQHLGDGPAPKD